MDEELLVEREVMVGARAASHSAKRFINAKPYAGRSAQKINSRARGAITSHGTHTLARNSSIASHETRQSPRTHLSLVA